MEELITSYLYSHKICPLPTVGTLVLQDGNAVAEQSDRLMFAPVPSVRFISKEMNADGLLQYISFKKNISVPDASDQLSLYCDRLLELQSSEEIKLGAAGNFHVSAEGELQFKATPVPSVFLPGVRAERVIHPDASHNMLVGDTQTNTSTMAELLDNNDISRRPKWLWAAIGLGLAGALALTFYLMNRPQGDLFGNGSKVQAIEASSSYK